MNTTISKVSLVLLLAAGAAAQTTAPTSRPAAAKPRKIAVVIDASASMMPRFEAAREAALKQVHLLQPPAMLNLFAVSRGKIATFQAAFVPATDANRAAAEKFIAQLSAAGAGDTMPVLRTALAAAPDDVYLICDGSAEKPARFLGEVRAALSAVGPRGKVRLHTFLDLAGNAAEPQRILRQIAADSGGTCAEEPLLTRPRPGSNTPAPASRPSIFGP